MTWTYDLTTPVGQIRDLVGDVLPSDPQLQDEEISLCLGTFSNIYFAAALAANKIASRYARQVTMSIGGELSASLGDLITHYKTLAASLRADGLRMGVPAYVGGLSKSDKATYQQDTDQEQPIFSREQFTVPSSQPTTPGDLVEQ